MDLESFFMNSKIRFLGALKSFCDHSKCSVYVCMYEFLTEHIHIQVIQTAYAFTIMNGLLSIAYFALIQLDFVHFAFNLLLWHHLYIFIHSLTSKLWLYSCVYIYI